MTARELNQLYHLNREIEQKQSQLEGLRTIATGATSQITGLPHGYGISDKVGNCSAEIADLENFIAYSIKRCLQEVRRLNEYIESVDDSLTRQILTFRHMNGLSWTQVAACIGGGNTKDSVRMLHDRFLRKERQKKR